MKGAVIVIPVFRINAFLLSLLFLVLPGWAATSEQIEGYELEKALANDLAGKVSQVVKDPSEAENFGKKVYSEGRCQVATLISGGSATSKFTTRNFGKNFYPDMSCAPDFILCNGKNVEIIEAKRQGTSATEQTKCIDELSKRVSSKGFNVNKKVVCSAAGACKAPRGWSKNVKKVSAVGVGTAATVVAAVGSNYYVSETDKDINSCVNQNFSRYELRQDGSYKTRDTHRAISSEFIYASTNYCSCWDNVQDRTRCCENIVLWGYTVMDMLNNNDLCSKYKSSDKYALCQKYVTSSGSGWDYCHSRKKGCVEERCGKFKTSVESTSNKPKYGRDTWIHKISRVFG